MAKTSAHPKSVLNWQAICELSNGLPKPDSVSKDEREGVRPPLQDPLTHIMNMRLDALTEPLAVTSSILGEVIGLVANDEQAAAYQAKGGIGYTPSEVAILRDLCAAVPAELWPERLRLIHQAKRDFQGTLGP